MKNISISIFAILLVFQISISFANSSKPKGKKSANYTNIVSEMKDALDTHDFGDVNITKGKVIVKYFVDENYMMHVTNIVGTNTELKDYVYNSLNGKEILTSGVNTNKETIIKFNFDLKSN